jgi:hypothetical protein
VHVVPVAVEGRFAWQISVGVEDPDVAIADEDTGTAMPHVASDLLQRFGFLYHRLWRRTRP